MPERQHRVGLHTGGGVVVLPAVGGTAAAELGIVIGDGPLPPRQAPAGVIHIIPAPAAAPPVTGLCAKTAFATSETASSKVSSVSEKVGILCPVARMYRIVAGAPAASTDTASAWGDNFLLLAAFGLRAKHAAH